MLVPFRFTTKSQLHLKTKDTLARIQSTLCLEDEEFSDFLEINPRQLERFRLEQRQIPLSAFMRLSERLNLNLEDLYHGRINYAALDVRFHKNELYIPEGYTVGAGSRFWTVINILNYIESKYGWHLRLQALRHFQLSERFLISPDRKINFRFMTDLLTYLSTQVMPGGNFFHTGQNIAGTFKKPELLKDLWEQRHFKNLYEVFFKKTIGFIDRNYFYKINYLRDTECEIRMVVNQDISESMKWKNPGSFNTCTYRAGVLSSVPHYLGLASATVHKTSCIHRGDTICSYHIKFPGNRIQSFH